MIYRKNKLGEDISQLGYGCMRFTKNGGSIDYEKAEQELLYAIENGVNYFDTAYIYPGSEECLGQILNRNHLREKVSIATKLPQYLMRSQRQIEKTFQEELRRLQTTYIDYYLMHMFTNYPEWENLRALGIEDWIREKKAEGKIRQIGFSYHGDTETFIKLLHAYDWDFCQIQFNYLDEHTQAGRKGLEEAYAMGIPVIIMEPLRGGKLVDLPAKAKQLLEQSTNRYSPAELGLRWLWDQPGITCVLSGMNSLDMVKENIRVASDARVGGFSEEDQAIVTQVKAIYQEREKVGCTGCRYCMPCPMGVDIPGNFYYYNLMSMENKKTGRWGFMQVMGLREKPGFASQCIGCGKCEAHCPQHLPIREKLKEADKHLRPLPYKIGLKIAQKFVLNK